MSRLAGLAAWIGLRRDNPDLLVAQARALTRQIPAMYFVLLVSALALVSTHYGRAPDLLTIGVFSLLAFVCVSRTIWWIHLARREIAAEEAERLLGGVLWLAAFLGPAFAIWALALFPYGDAYRQGQVIFFMGITVVVCTKSLSHLPVAAGAVLLGVVVPMILYLGLSDQPVYNAMAFNVAAVGGAVILLIMTLYREFLSLVESRTALAEKMALAERLNAENERLANLDTLTTLPNRRLFFAELERRIDEDRTGTAGLAMGIIDLDGFKPVNDAFGHAAGDRLLRDVADRLARAAGTSMFVARLGGDEFGIIVSASASESDILELGRALCAMLRLPFPVPGGTVRISATIGFCVRSGNADTAARLFERADYALYYAKERGKGGVAIFDESHAAEILEFGRIEQALRRADLEHEINLVYQPIVDCVAGRTVAFEALARWRSAELGNVMPSLFIRAAERSGLIGDITRVVVAKALACAISLPKEISISINLSPHDLASSTGIDAILALVLSSGVAPGRIIFEVTETAMVADMEQARGALQAFRDFGVKIALDDFGTGFSSLSHLRSIPLDRLKIDSSFTRGIESDPNSEGIVKGVFDLCRNIGVSCIVEGVETRAQLDKIRLLGGALTQGYYFARPMSPEAIPDYLADEHARRLRERLREADEPAQGKTRAEAKVAGARA